jgi:DNA/RNA-binding domain of Phe-tRNA-synthetase-like protein
MMVRLDLEVADRVLVGVAWFSGVSAASDNPFWDEMETLAQTLRRAHGGRAPAEIEGLEPGRRLYHQFGIDPTRTRPSSEALLRRVLKGESLYQINRLVDAVNWASLAMLLPIGLYDLDRVNGDVLIRRGRPGEHYGGIRKSDVNVEERLTLADQEGPFGSPTSDSERTSIRPETSRVAAAIFAPVDFARPELEEGLERMSRQVLRWCGGEREGAWILGGARP